MPYIDEDFVYHEDDGDELDDDKLTDDPDDCDCGDCCDRRLYKAEVEKNLASSNPVAFLAVMDGVVYTDQDEFMFYLRRKRDMVIRRN